MIALLAALLIVTVISIALVGMMDTDLSHASIQFAVARSFYIAQAGLAEAAVQASAAADPAAYTTPDEGVTASFGSGRFTYWVDAGPAAGCGPGLKTLESHGEADVLGRTIGARVRGCAVGGAPFLAALFGVGPVQFRGRASRVYLAPYQVGTPGGGGNLGSFAEINFADADTRVNALSETTTDMVTLRDGTFADYQLFGFPTAPEYNADPEADPTPWISSAFGDLIKARSATDVIPNRCGTDRACVTVGDNITDVPGISALRGANYLRHVYLKDIREETLPRIALDPATLRAWAAQNIANAALNRAAHVRDVPTSDKTDSVYTRIQFYQLLFYLRLHPQPQQFLQGPIYVDGSFEFLSSVGTAQALGSVPGNVTLAVAGDVIIDSRIAVTLRHDLSTVAGLRTPGLLVLGSPHPVDRPKETCGGQHVTGSGRLVLCGGSTLTVDGLVYTQDGMAVEPGALVDQVGAMYHNNRGTPNPSFMTQDATVVLRFEPLALSALGTGIAMLSWQQVP